MRERYAPNARRRSFDPPAHPRAAAGDRGKAVAPRVFYSLPPAQNAPSRVPTPRRVAVAPLVMFGSAPAIRRVSGSRGGAKRSLRGFLIPSHPPKTPRHESLRAASWQARPFVVCASAPASWWLSGHRGGAERSLRGFNNLRSSPCGRSRRLSGKAFALPRAVAPRVIYPHPPALKAVAPRVV